MHKLTGDFAQYRKHDSLRISCPFSHAQQLGIFRSAESIWCNEPFMLARIASERAKYQMRSRVGVASYRPLRVSDLQYTYLRVKACENMQDRVGATEMRIDAYDDACSAYDAARRN